MKKTMTVTCLAASLAASGCASIISKSQYPVTINSNPPGATIVVKNKSGAEIHKAQTPTTITLNASAGFFSPASYSVEFSKEGYQKTTASQAASIDGWYVANILFGGLIGLLLVDPATGAMWKLDENLTASLSIDPAAATTQIPLIERTSQGDGGVEKSIADQLKELKQLKDNGVITNQEYEQKRKPLVDKL